MHPDQLGFLALSHQADLLTQAERVRNGRPFANRPRVRRRWRGRFAT
jgi:hypothetical protein